MRYWPVAFWITIGVVAFQFPDFHFVAAVAFWMAGGIFEDYHHEDESA